MAASNLTILVAAAIFLAAFTQSISGFGVSLVAMGLLAGPLGLRQASPLVALAASLLEIALLARHWQALNWRTVWRLLAGALLGIPIGLALARVLPERWVLGAFGVLLIGYGLYALARPTLPRLTHAAWPYVCGLAGGVLSGAYNASGPPVVVYGSSQGWSAPEFKGNLQSFFLFNHLLVIAGHAISGNYTPEVWRYVLYALPALAAGLGLGLALERYVTGANFRKIVLILLILVGVRLVVG